MVFKQPNREIDRLRRSVWIEQDKEGIDEIGGRAALIILRWHLYHLRCMGKARPIFQPSALPWIANGRMWDVETWMHSKEDAARNRPSFTRFMCYHIK